MFASHAYSSSPLNTQADPSGIVAAGAGGSGVYMNVVSAKQVVFTWDRLGYFRADYADRVQFQLMLTSPATLQSGESAIGFGDGLSAITKASWACRRVRVPMWRRLPTVLEVPGSA